MRNGQGKNVEKMDGFEDPSNTWQTIVGEELLADAKLIAEEKKNKPNEETENKLNEEVEGSKKKQ